MFVNPKPEEEKLMSDDIFEDIFDEAEALQSVDGDTTKQLSGHVRQMRSLEEQIADAEAHIKALKQQKHSLATEIIPNMMDQMGVERLDVDGVSVVRKNVVHASIPPARKEEAFDWLRQNGHDDIIKNDIICSFGRGQDNEAGHVLGALREQGYDPQQKVQVHPMTLKAFVREQIEQGANIDLEMFGAYILNTAEIKRK
jgi:hypothetical protein